MTEKYRKYLASKKWLLKKHQLISYYLKNKFRIECNDCGRTDYLQVDHTTYKNIMKEKLEDLQFLCRECHQHKHSPDFESFTKAQWKYVKKLERFREKNKDKEWWGITL